MLMKRVIKASEVYLVPVCEVGGIQTHSDRFVLSLYDRMVKEGAAEVVFYDGEINCADDWLRFMRHGGNLLYLVYDGTAELIGVVWLNTFVGRSANGHFCMFKSARGRMAKDVPAKIATELLFQGSMSHQPALDVIIGAVPAWNKAAQRWIFEGGFRLIGAVPYGAYHAGDDRSGSMMLFCFTKDQATGREGQNEGI